MREKLEIKREGNKIFAPLKNKFLIETPEETVRQNYIVKLVNHYGYSLDQMEQEKEVANSQRGQGRASADIVIWKSAEDKRKGKNAFIVVECKAENITVRKEDYFQGFNYATWAGASFFVTTNEKETKFFNVDKDYLPQKLQEITDIPKAKDVNNEKKIDNLLKSLKKFERDEFAKLLFACHNIIRNNDKFSPEMAFDEISKILFMKIKYERNPDEDAIFSLEQFKKSERNYEKNIRPSLKGTPKDLPYMQFLFDRTKDEFIDDELFEPNEQIKIRQVSFEAIVEKLQIYNLSDTSDDVKGIAFEKFLGKTFRGELGQFFTPRTIVDYMVNILDPQEGETICDPTAGSGGFLIKAFEHIRSKIEADIQKLKEKIKEKFDLPAPILEKPLNNTQKEQLKTRLIKIISEEEGKENIQKILNLSDRDAAKILNKIEEIEQSDILQLQDFIKEKQEIDNEIKNIDNSLQISASSKSEKELFEELQQTMESCQTQIGRLTVKIQNREEELLQLNEKIKEIELEINRLYEKHHISREKVLFIEECDAIANLLNTFKVNLRKNKVKLLQEKTFEMYKMLSSKAGLIKDLEINTKTYEIIILDKNGHEMKKSSLSAGEKEVFAVSLLWGLAQTSKLKLPIIIDTPLSRLDSSHRDNIVRYYFPNAAEQVIILSTDTEVDNNYFKNLEPNLANAARLEFDINNELTTIKEGYFWN